MKIIIGVYFVVQILVLSALMVIQVKLPIHTIMMSLSCLAYIIVSYKKPGYYQPTNKQISISDQIHNENKIGQANGIDQVDEDQQFDLSDFDTVNKSTKNAQQANQKFNEEQYAIKKPKTQNNLNVQSKKCKVSKKSSLKIITAKNAEQKDETLVGKRYCRLCKIVQPYRVRHCHECQKCISTFDHHCPWMGNCIGQKNRPIFWIYLFIQFLQFLIVEIDVFNTISKKDQLKHVYFFAMALTLVTIISFGLLAFHTYLMCINLTTWQFARWDKISYLMIWGQRSTSPFSFGWANNIYDYFHPLTQKQNTEWMFNPQYKKEKIDKQKINVKQHAQTQRVIAKPLAQY